ncbi:unnamed protein product, partial [Mycena citricolor]
MYPKVDPRRRGRAWWKGGSGTMQSSDLRKFKRPSGTLSFITKYPRTCTALKRSLHALRDRVAQDSSIRRRSAIN